MKRLLVFMIMVLLAYSPAWAMKDEKSYSNSRQIVKKRDLMSLSGVPPEKKAQTLTYINHLEAGKTFRNWRDNERGDEEERRERRGE